MVREAQQYQPVPVEAAQQIASDHAKAMVIIVAWDQVHQLTHITTYGTTPQLKGAAATAGDQVAKFLNLDQSRLASFEDFRHRDQAEQALAIERLKGEADQLKAQLDQATMEATIDEAKLQEIDAFAHEHFKAIGQPLPPATNFGEGALCLREELPRLRGEVERRDARRANGEGAGR